MTKSILAFTVYAAALSCGQNESSVKSSDATSIQQLSFDTSKITILPIDTSQYWLFKDASSMRLTNQDLKSIDNLLNHCIEAHNSKQDTTKEFNGFIDLKKYKIQYVPFISSGEKRKVYINAFCNYYWGFNSSDWRTNLVYVDDGGSCFFHLTINLTDNKYEEFYINGYA